MDPFSRLTIDAMRIPAPPPTRGWTRCQDRLSSDASVAPPPTRGWTLMIVGAVPPQYGSPAHAGMDP